jgi:tRNA A37 threonylcarbamoyladenosine synthetase subunit TsaC/SUA5/YrdC
MKTVMQDLIEWYQKEHFVKTTFHIQLLNKFESLVEKEKEQIMMAFNDGKINSVLKKRDSEEYYNQTYKNR